MDLTMCSRVCFLQGDKTGNKVMRKAILGAASALALASPAVAADLPVPRYSEVPGYEREVHPYEYRNAPVVVEEPAPVVSETLVVRRPVIIVPPPVGVDEYPLYAAPRVYAAPPVYAYAGPAWRDGWGHRLDEATPYAAQACPLCPESHIDRCSAHVRFVPEADMTACHSWRTFP
jgi:hypothetical protein